MFCSGSSDTCCTVLIDSVRRRHWLQMNTMREAMICLKADCRVISIQLWGILRMGFHTSYSLVVIHHSCCLVRNIVIVHLPWTLDEQTSNIFRLAVYLYTVQSAARWPSDSDSSTWYCSISYSTCLISRFIQYLAQNYITIVSLSSTRTVFSNLYYANSEYV